MIEERPKGGTENLGETEAIVREMVFEVVQELGPDISYVRLTQTDGKDRTYLTGAEVGSVIAAGVVASFLFGVAKGVSEQFGKELGKATASMIAKQLEALRRKIRDLLTKNSEGFRAEFHSIESELSAAEREVHSLEVELTAETREIVTREQEIEVREELSRYGFTSRAIERHSSAIVRNIKRTERNR